MKKLLHVVPLVLLFCFTIACQDKAAKAELEKFRAQAALEEQNKEIIKRYVEEEAKGNLLRIIDEIVAPDVVYHYPNNNNVRGLEAIKQAGPVFSKAFPDLKVIIELQIAKGDLVAARFRFNATHKGEWMGIALTGKELSYTANEIARISNGKIAEAWIELDQLGFVEQLGMELKPIAAKKK
jgi:predicted ester cyclase